MILSVLSEMFFAGLFLAAVGCAVIGGWYIAEKIMEGLK